MSCAMRQSLLREASGRDCFPDMAEAVKEQLIRLAASFAAGAVTGLVYDVFRTARRLLNSRIADAVLDALFWALTFLALFTLGMDAGAGALHIEMLAFACLGFAAYMITFSDTVMKFMQSGTYLIEKMRNLMKNRRKNSKKAAKKSLKFLKDGLQ